MTDTALQTGVPLKKKRLLIVGAFPPQESKIQGGVVTSCKLLLKSDLVEQMNLILLDSTQRSVPPPPLLARALYAIPRGIRFLRQFHLHKPDVVLLFASVGMGFLEKALYVIYARLFGIPSMLFLRGGGLMTSCRNSSTYRLLVKTMLRAPRYLLCQEKTWQSFFVNDMSIAPERCPVIKNWTATPDLLAIGEKRGYQQKDETVILFMGWLDRQKGVMELIQAVARLKDAYPSLRLSMAGEGDCSARARSWVKQHELDSIIRFEGWVHGEKKLDLLRSSDIFCLPSYAEGLPNAMVEAMAAGLPVVATPVGVVPDVIDDGKNGLLVKTADVTDLEEKLKLILSDVDKRNALGRRGYETAVTDFGLDLAARKLYIYAIRAISKDMKQESLTGGKS